MLLVLPAGKVTVEGNIEIEHNFRDSKVTEGLNVAETEVEVQDTVYDYDVEDKDLGYVIEYRGNKNKAINLLEKDGYEVIDSIEVINRLLIKEVDVTPDEFRPVEVYPEIVSIEENSAVYPTDYTIPSDSKFEEQWSKFAMRLPQAWRDVTGSSNIRIAVIDTGIYENNIELEQFVNRDDGWNFYEDNNDTHDYWGGSRGHGTQAAGIISAQGNYANVAGVMWESELIPLKMFGEDSGSTWALTKSILYSGGFEVDGMQIEPVDVISASVSGPDTQSTRDAVEKLSAQTDVIFVTSAGNDGRDGVDSLTYPAKYPETIAVGSVSNRGDDRRPVRSSFSSYGEGLDLVAPGRSVISTHQENNTRFVTGTSFSSPQVAGLVGLMLANGINPGDVRDILSRTAIDLWPREDDYENGWYVQYGYGLVNAYWAVNDVSEINISIGDNETTVDLNADSYVIEDVPAGEYELKAWIDVRGNGIEAGDYVATEQVVLENGEYNIDLTLKEVR